jgi:hypothetical protein
VVSQEDVEGVFVLHPNNNAAMARYAITKPVEIFCMLNFPSWAGYEVYIGQMGASL